VGSAVSRAIDEISKQISLIWSSLFILLHGTNHQVAELQKARPAPPQASQEANPSRTTVCSFGWWLVLICFERKVLLADCWWLVYSERKVLLAGG
jgi:hypothetical protein